MKVSLRLGSLPLVLLSLGLVACSGGITLDLGGASGGTAAAGGSTDSGTEGGGADAGGGGDTDSDAGGGASPLVPQLSYVSSTGTTGGEGQAFSVTPSQLVDHGFAITQCAVKSGTTALPSWATLDATTCVISGQPIKSLASTTYQIVATNSEGTSAHAAVTLSVDKSCYGQDATYLASKSLASVPGNGSSRINTGSSSAYEGVGSLSQTGRYVVFYSSATNLVAGDTNNVADIFLHDRETGVTERISVASNGDQANGASTAASVSADGRYVVFDSVATNLVLGDTNAARDVFLRDRTAGTTTRISVDTSGTQSNGDSHYPSISADGKFVAFHSTATNLIGLDTNGVADVFLRWLDSGVTSRVSVNSEGTAGNGASTDATLSADGRYVAFTSAATNLLVDDDDHASDTNGFNDVFLRDRSLGITIVVSQSDSEALANQNSWGGSVSADGSRVSFTSQASNLVASDTNGVNDVFVRDVSTKTTSLVSVKTDGTQAGAVSYLSTISGNGRYVAFYSAATNLVAGDTNGLFDLFVRDLTLSTTERASVGVAGAEANNNAGYSPGISQDGRYVSFYSNASNLTCSGSTQDQIYVVDRDAL